MTAHRRRQTAFLHAQARSFNTDRFIGRTVAGEFDLVELLGVGAQGRVYRALQRPFGRPVALKLFTGDAIASEAARVRAFREAQALGALSAVGIPRLVRFGELDVDGHPTDGFFLALELIEGRSLRAVLDDEGAIEPTRALTITRALLRTLGEMHRQGIAHRDIKPSHILLTRDAFGAEQVSLIDFGIARREGGFAYEGPGAPPSEEGRLMGSPAYMAPEPMIDGSVAGPAADQYAVGVVLFEMLTGVLPFDGDLQDVLAGHMMDAVPAVLGDLDPTGAIQAVLDRAMAKWCDERFADPAEMDRALAAIVEGPTATREPAPIPASAAPDLAVPAATPDHQATAKLPPSLLLRPSLPARLSSHTRQILTGIVVGVMAAASSAAGAVLMGSL